VTQTVVTERHIHRFTPLQRRLHLALMTSFLGLAATGLPLLFSAAPWAGWLSRLFGGFEMAGLLHRAFATVMLATFGIHVAHLAYRLLARKEWSMLWGPASMVPQPRDLHEFVGHVRGSSTGDRVRASTATPTGRSSTTGRCSGACSSSAARGCCCGSRSSSRRSCRAGSSTSRCSSMARRRCWPWRSSSRFTSSTATSGRRSSRWTW
jgi:hypothetical protein